MDTMGKVDVAMFYNDNDLDRKWATDIEEELLKLPKKDGERLEIRSYDDLIPGYSKVESRIMLTKASRVNLLIVTPEFTDDNWNGFEAQISVHDAVESRKPKVVYIQLCDETKVNLVLQHLTGIKAKGKSINKIAKMIKNLHDLIENKETTPRIIPVNCFKLNLMIEAICDALNEHFQIDKVMVDLWKKMNTNIQKKLQKVGQRKDVIITPTTDKIGCDCSEGELWKEEIHEKEYWSTDAHPFKNIKKYKNDHKKKHTDDVHKLFCGNGKHHVALTSVYLAKRQIVVKPLSECKGVLEFLDPNGILQLLQNCAEFLFSGGNDALEEVILARHLVAHLPINFPPDNLKAAITIVKEAATSIGRELSPEVRGQLDANIEETDSMIIEAKVKNPGSPIEVSCGDENCEATFDSILHQFMEKLAIK